MSFQITRTILVKHVGNSTVEGATSIIVYCSASHFATVYPKVVSKKDDPVRVTNWAGRCTNCLAFLEVSASNQDPPVVCKRVTWDNNKPIYLNGCGAMKVDGYGRVVEPGIEKCLVCRSK